jgi:hypothetical protein
MTIVFDTERLSFLSGLIIHYISIHAMILTLSYFNGWIRNFSSISKILAYTTSLYFLSWCLVIIKNYINAKELNKMLKKNI